jgi:hypothetical protein
MVSIAFTGGGGVYVVGGFFTKADSEDGNSGIIYGSDAGDGLKNTANNDSSGHAVYNYISSSSGKTRNSTLDANTGINTSNLSSPPWD